MPRKKYERHTHPDFENGEDSNRWWLLTYNNPPQAEWQTIMDKLSPEYWLGQLEKGQQGTLHIQAIAHWKDRISWSFWRGKTFHAIPIKSQDVPRVLKYCSKEDTRIEGPVERGKRPRAYTRVDTGSSAKRVSTDYSAALQLAKEGKFEDIDPSLQIRNWSNLAKIHGFYAEAIETPECRGLWIYGPPGWGKSTYAREGIVENEIYTKAQNKWFDGYRGQTYVILDDLDHGGACLSHYLKIWLDRYKFWPEIKGGYTAARYLRFVITSNYLPSDLWQDPLVVEAVTRRCKFVCYYEKFKPTIGDQFGIIPKKPIPEDSFINYISFFKEYDL